MKIWAQINGIFKDVSNLINTENRIHIDNEFFIGSIVLRVKNYGNLLCGTNYFSNKKRLYSYQFEGQFKQDINGDDFILGAEFDQKINPPLGTSIMIKFAKIIDPGLCIENLYSKEEDIRQGKKPRLYSPALCAMNIMQIMDYADNGKVSEVKENTSKQVWPKDVNTSESKRRSYFLNKDYRKAFVFKKGIYYKFDWFSPYVDWNNFEIKMGLTLRVSKYLNGQGVYIVGRTRDCTKVFFVLKIEP